MKSYAYKKINAFTTPTSLGNPAACVYLNEDETLTSETMLEIAKQHKGFVSEVVFCKELRSKELHLTYYSSECEVDFCGHGTIACMYSLIKSSPDLLKKKEISVQTNKKGRLTIYNNIPEENTIYITAPDPLYLTTDVTPDLVASYLGIPSESISTEHPIELINAGLATLIVPITTLSEEVNINPDRKQLEEFCINHGLDTILIYSLEVQRSEHFAHTRVFAPKYGYLEDPATGSGNSALGYYLLLRHLWDGAPISIEQGSIQMAYNTVKLVAKHSNVFFGGAATDCIVGQYYIEEGSV